MGDDEIHFVMIRSTEMICSFVDGGGFVLNEQLQGLMLRLIPGATDVAIEELVPIPGGFSRETFRFDARVKVAGVDEVFPCILRKDPPKAAALLDTSRQVEHELIEAVRLNTTIPVTRSWGAEMDASVFGEPAMVLQRSHGSGQTSELFNGGVDEHQADDVMRHLCESMVALHTTDISKLNPGGALSDPRNVGIDISSWDSYIDSTIAYYLGAYHELDFDPITMVLLDMFLTLRRSKPRPLQLSLVHGDFNPANFLYHEGKVTALIDWENSHIGDPREDLGWMTTMDILSNSHVMDHPRDKGGFLNYYNELTGWNITPEELDYFTLFGTGNIAVPVFSAIKRRINKEHMQFLHLYIIQPALSSIPNVIRLLNYPGVSL